MSVRKFQYGNHCYEYSLVKSKRKTMALYLFSDKRIEVRAPNSTKLSDVETFLRKKGLWLERKLNEIECYKKPHYEMRYLPGESLQYLGRQLILEVRPSVETDEAVIEHTKLIIYSNHDSGDAEWNKRLIEKCLANSRSVVFEQQYRLACERFVLSADETPTLKIRNMKTRWGTYSAHTNTVYLTSRLIEAPIEAILYVCIHELCHLRHRKHDKSFYEAMDRYQEPNWRMIKKELNLKYG